MKNLHTKKRCILYGILVFSVLCGLLWLLRRDVPTDTQRFDAYIKNLFIKSVQQDTLTLHYTVADPEAMGISSPVPFLGDFPDGNVLNTAVDLENTYSVLCAFEHTGLDADRLLTLEILKDDVQRQLATAASGYYLQSYISPSLGVSAQLPVLLAEYTFRSQSDLDTYFALLKDLDRYFTSLLEYIRLQKEKGAGPDDTTLERVISQCRNFIGSGDETHFLQTTFDERCHACSFLSAEDQNYLTDIHLSYLTDYVFPAYESFMDGLSALKGSGQSPCGLGSTKSGLSYYKALVAQETGCDMTLEEIRNRLQQQLVSDIQSIQALPAETFSGSDPYEEMSPEEMLLLLQSLIREDFPEIQEVSYELKEIQSELADFASPAFYMIPPVDAVETNTIYTNPVSEMSGIELFSTLAHEAFPGHLYQTNFFNQTSPNVIRRLTSPDGYVEGWATYVESWLCTEADGVWSGAKAYWLERSLNLCIASLMDIGVHGYGWKTADAAAFLAAFGVTDEAAVSELYQYVVENPANYLKYYLGYLCFLDLRTSCEEAMGDAFDLKDFHTAVLTAGPCSFSILESQVYKLS